MTGTLFLAGTARSKSMQETRFAGACQDQHAGRLRLAWGGLAKEINRCNKPRQASSKRNATSQGYGAWGRARAARA